MLPHLSTFSSPLCPASTSAIGQRSCRPTSLRCGRDTRRTPGLFLCTSSPNACRGASLPHSAKARKVALQSGSLPIQRQNGQLTPSAIWPRRSIWGGNAVDSAIQELHDRGALQRENLDPKDGFSKTEYRLHHQCDLFRRPSKKKAPAEPPEGQDSEGTAPADSF